VTTSCCDCCCAALKTDRYSRVPKNAVPMSVELMNAVPMSAELMTAVPMSAEPAHFDEQTAQTILAQTLVVRFALLTVPMLAVLTTWVHSASPMGLRFAAQLYALTSSVCVDETSA